MGQELQFCSLSPYLAERHTLVDLIDHDFDSVRKLVLFFFIAALLRNNNYMKTTYI
jgi:cell division protein FtsL